MKFINTMFLIGLFLIAYSTIIAKQLSDSFQIFPKPKKVEVFSERGLEFGELKSIQFDESIDRPVLGYILSLLPEKSKKTGGKLVLKILDNSSVPESPEGYVLTISNGNVEITSLGEAGLFYGCQTLEQMLVDTREHSIPIPSCKITDYPDYVYRSVHFDTKHHLDHIGYYYESINRLARYKINWITWEFEDLTWMIQVEELLHELVRDWANKN